MRSRPSSTAKVLLLSLAAALGACDTPTESTEPPAELTELPRALTAVEREAIDGANGFAFELLRRLDADRGGGANVVISPLSASMSLGMALNGAAGETFAAMRGVLGFGGIPLEEINVAYAGLLDLLVDLDPSSELGIANSVWVDVSHPLLPDYQSRVVDAFDAEVENLPLAAPASADRINRWGNAATRGLIEEIVAPRELGNTIVLLVNALYFKGSWRTGFDPSHTTSSEFRRVDGSTVPVPMMRLPPEKEPLGFAFGDEYRAAELPYGNGAFSMIVVVPDRGADLAALVEAAGPAWWAELTGRLQPERIDLRLPRFTLTFDSQLGPALRAMGMDVAFDPAHADFSRMVDAPGAYIGWVKQKTFITVDEEGTEAAAVTATAIDQSEPPAVHADQPFLFAIRERFSGTILFLGVVVDPS